MRNTFLSAALLIGLVQPAMVSAQDAAPAKLSLDQKTALRCATAFAIVAEGQARGDAAMQAYPDLRERGREFFVRSSAQLMDQTGMDRAGVAALMHQEALALRAAGEVDKIMPSCLLLLTASGV